MSAARNELVATVATTVANHPEAYSAAIRFVPDGVVVGGISPEALVWLVHHVKLRHPNAQTVRNDVALTITVGTR